MKTRKFLAILLTLAMCLGMLPGMAMATPPTGTSGDFYVDSSNENLYHIANLAGLKEFRNRVNGNGYTEADNFSGKTIQLDDGIDLTGETWEPIGKGYYKSGMGWTNKLKPGSTPFAGTFDGNGNTISNLRVATSDSSDSANGWAAGLFGLVTGTVQNLTINNATVSSATRFAGAVAGGVMSGGAINNCNVTGTAEISGRHFVGGVAGMSYGTLSNCSVTADGTIAAADAENKDGDDVGGLVGFVQSGNSISGGVAAAVSGCMVNSTGLTISGIRQLGGLVGAMDNASTTVGGTVSGVTVKSIATTEQNVESKPTNTIGSTVGNVNGLSHSATASGVTMEVTTAPQLAAAVADVGVSTIKLGADVTLTESVAVAKQITLDLNGKRITTAEKVRAFVLTSGADMTVEDNGTTKGGITATGNDAFYLNNQGEADKTDASKVKLDIRSGVSVSSTTDCAVFYRGSVTLTTAGSLSSNGEFAVIQGNGSDTYATTVVTVTDGSVTGSNSIAIYFPNPGTLNISGGTLSGKESAVELRAGTLNVTGGTFTATATSYSCNPNASGTTTVGAAVAIAQHTTDKPIAASITGATFNVQSGAKAISVQDPENVGLNNVTVTSSITKNTAIPEGFSWSDNGDGTSSLINGADVAKIGGKSYATLEAAIEAAQDGDTITLIADVTKHANITSGGVYTIEKSLTIDGQNHTVTVANDKGIGYAFYINDNDVAKTLNCTIQNMVLNTTGYQVAIMLNGDFYSTLDVNHVNVTCDGECIYSNGHATVNATNCEFTHDGLYAPGKDFVYYSALIAGYGGDIVVENCSVTSFGNGAATFPSGGSVTMTNTNISIDEASSVNENAGYAMWARNEDYTSYPEYCKDSVITFNSGNVVGDFKITDTYSTGHAKKVN